jgi:hypothetical protein
LAGEGGRLPNPHVPYAIFRKAQGRPLKQARGLDFTSDLWVISRRFALRLFVPVAIYSKLTVIALHEWKYNFVRRTTHDKSMHQEEGL